MRSHVFALRCGEPGSWVRRNTESVGRKVIRMMDHRFQEKEGTEATKWVVDIEKR